VAGGVAVIGGDMLWECYLLNTGTVIARGALESDGEQRVYRASHADVCIRLMCLLM